MEENEDEPEDVRKSTPVEIEIRVGEKDETAGNLQSGAKKPKHKSPSCDVKNRRKNKVENQLVKFEEICCRGRNSRPFKPPKSMSVFIYSPLCSLPKLEIIPRHCLSKKEYIDMLATPSRKCPPPCCGKTVVRRIRPVSARMNELAQPARRQLMATLQDRGESLPAEMIDNLVKTMEENSCLTPEQAEDYFRDKNPRKCRKSARRSRKSKRQSRKQESCGSQLDKESVTNQYLMAERLVKSILQWRCSIPTEDFQDIANVILRRLSLTLEYDPMDDKDLRSQQMRFLADVIACWISGVLFEVSEDHRKEIEEEWKQRQLEAERNREEEEISVTIDFGDPPGGGKDKDSDKSRESDEVESNEDEESKDGRKSAYREERREKSRKWRKKGGRLEKESSRRERKSSESVGSPVDEGGEESSRKGVERRLRREEREKQRRREEEQRRKDRALEKERARKSEERRKREEEEEERERKRERRRKEKEERRIKEAEARRKRREAEKKRREDEKKKEREEEEERKKKEEEEKRKKDEEEEKRRKEEEERILREEEEKRKKEEEEKKKQEEEERRKKEEEEKMRKEEEERKKKEEEEEKKRKEEEEKLKEEAAAKKRKEEEEKKREESKRKAEEEKKLKEAEKKRRKEEEKKKRERAKRLKEAGEQETRGDRSGTYGPVLDTIYNVLDELPGERVETDPVHNRIQRAISEKVLRRVESEDPASVDENFKDVVDVVASKAAAWLKEVLMDAGLRIDERSIPTVRSVEVREWAKWVDEVTEKANDWADWIHKLVEDAEEKSTEQVNRGEWYDWTSEAETDALLWRRYYLETTHQAHRNEMMMAGRPVAKTGNENQPANPVEMEITDTDI